MNTQMKSSEIPYHVGVDVSKDKLDIYSPETCKVFTIINDPKAIQRSWQQGLIPKRLDLHLVVEASGGYEKTLTTWAHDKDITVSVVNPARVKYFKRAEAEHAKTDAIDAAMITRFARKHLPDPTPKPSAAMLELQALSRRRTHLVSQRAIEKGLLDKERQTFVKREIRLAIRQLDARISKLDEQIARVIEADPELTHKAQIMRGVCGVGPVASAVLLAEMPELGSLSDNQAASLAGLAPYPDDSGKKSGKRFIRGGRGRVRKALFMPATCAIRHNPILKAFYENLIARGKAHHLAITAVMRKLIRLINRLLSDSDFVLEKFS